MPKYWPKRPKPINYHKKTDGNIGLSSFFYNFANNNELLWQANICAKYRNQNYCQVITSIGVKHS